MYFLATTTLFSSGFFCFMFFFPFHLVLFSHQTGFLSLLPPPSLFSQLNQGLTAPWRKKKICHFIFQYNQERMCPAPICPFGGIIAMLQRFNCANRVGGSQRQCRTWSCAIIKLQWFIYFSFRSTKSLFFGLLLTIFISETCFLEP